MTDPSRDPRRDPVEVLQAHVRAVAVLEVPSTDPDDLVADITGSIDRADRSRTAQVLPMHGPTSPRRRRWLVAGAAAATVAVGAAGVAAYVAARPADPVAGIMCRSSDDFGSASVVLPLDADPVAACANLWKTGDLPGLAGGQASGVVPDLVACTGGAGAIEVLPVSDDESCATFGLVPAELGPDPVSILRREVAFELSEGCRSPAELLDVVERQVAELGLTGWEVRLEAGVQCALAAIDVAERRIDLIEDPLSSPSRQETP